MRAIRMGRRSIPSPPQPAPAGGAPYILCRSQALTADGLGSNGSSVRREVRSSRREAEMARTLACSRDRELRRSRSPSPFDVLGSFDTLERFHTMDIYAQVPLESRA